MTIDSRHPCLLYGDGHWRDIEADLRRLADSGRQAFIGTMNTFVMDCFFFESVQDVQSRILIATRTGGLFRFSNREACLFYSAYETGIQHVSEIFRTKDLW